ncbi:MAG: sulfatase [Planctomycetota bacterium]
MIRRLPSLAASLSAIWLLSCGITYAQQAAKPNVLMIAIDDLNDWVGCMGGHPGARTPNIDRLAASGTLFTNAHCQAPICGPSRASLFTGLRPSTTGIYLQINDRDIRDSNQATRQCTFLPDYFEAHGYKSLAAGKLFHNGDRAKVFGEHGTPSSMGPKPEKRFNFDPAWYDDRVGTTQTDWAAYPEQDDMMPDHRTASWAETRLAQPHDRPFFMAVGFCRPHVPWYVPQKWFDMHPLSSIQTPEFDPQDLDDVPDISRRLNEAPMMPTTDWAIETKQWKKIVQAYLACTTFVDHQVGRVLAALEASEYSDNTIIVLWSDHGYHIGEKNRFAKQAIWEEATHVNLIFSGRGLKLNQRSDQPTELLDIYPTLVELAGLPANGQNEGQSLVPLLDQPNADWSHVAITTYGRNNHSIRSQRFRYVVYEDGSEELYDHRHDSLERINLADRPELASVKQRMRKHLPDVNVPLAAKSQYKFNDYFRKRMPAWRQE